MELLEDNGSNRVSRNRDAHCSYERLIKVCALAAALVYGEAGMNMYYRFFIILVALTTLAGCASSGLTGTTYSRSDARKVQTVKYGTIESVTPVTIEGRTDGIVGTGSGAIIGGIAGSTVGGGKGRSIATVVGAVAGGLAGQAAEKKLTTKQGQELTIRLESTGDIISVVQEVENDQFFNPGDRIRLLQHGGNTRVTY